MKLKFRNIKTAAFVASSLAFSCGQVEYDRIDADVGTGGKNAADARPYRGTGGRAESITPGSEGGSAGESAGGSAQGGSAGTEVQESNGFENLIGDFMNKTLQDRVDNNTFEPDSFYEMGGSDLSDTANPFTDGSGSNLGIEQTYMFRAGENATPEFSTVLLNGVPETQAMWISGNNHFDHDVDDVVGQVDFFAYSIKLGDNNGIELCDFSGECPETHQIRSINLFGVVWEILDASPPQQSNSDVVPGGFITIGKVAYAGLLYEGETLFAGGLDLSFSDISYDGTTSATLSVGYGGTRKLERFNYKQTKELIIEGEDHIIHLSDASVGNSSEPAYVYVSVLLTSFTIGQDYLYGQYDVTLGWKGEDSPTSLRTMIFSTDNIENVSSSGTNRLEEGDYIPMATYNLRYGGLDITDSDRHNLVFESKNNDKQISDSSGPVINGEQQECTIQAPYVEISSYDSNLSLDISVDDELIVVSNPESTCGQMNIPAGSVLIRRSRASDDYDLYPYDGAISIDYPEIEGTIKIETRETVESNRSIDDSIGFRLSKKAGSFPECTSADCADIYFGVFENNGVDNDAMIFGFNGSFDIDSYSALHQISSNDEKILYSSSGPVNPEFAFIEGGTITNRGSVFESISDNSVTFLMANKVAKAQWSIE